MTIRFPKPLAAGDLIAVTAPSSGVPAPLHARLDLALGALKKRGYRVIEGQCLRQQNKDASAPREQRAAELIGFLTNPQVAAVMPPWGGDLAIELLDLIDFHALARLPAKWFVGFSDLSTLQLPLTNISGWATLHGPNLMELGAAETDEMTAGIWRMLTAEPHVRTAQRSSSRFQRQGVDWAVQPDVGLALSEASQWKRLDGSTAPLHVSGRLIGGCIDSISRLAGTPYGNVPAFVTSSGSAGTLLHLENCELKPCELARALHSMRLNGWFEGLSGILLGRSAAPETTQSNALNYLDALQSGLGEVSCPVLYDMDIGHLPPQLSLVSGASAEVEFRNGTGQVIQQLNSTHTSGATFASAT